MSSVEKRTLVGEARLVRRLGRGRVSEYSLEKTGGSRTEISGENGDVTINLYPNHEDRSGEVGNLIINDDGYYLHFFSIRKVEVGIEEFEIMAGGDRIGRVRGRNFPFKLAVELGIRTADLTAISQGAYVSSDLVSKIN